MSSASKRNTTFSTNSSHILGRDGAPIPKQPQSTVKPRTSADSSAEKKTTEMSAIASALTRLVEGQSNRRPHAISNGGRLNASRLMNAAGRIRFRRRSREQR